MSAVTRLDEAQPRQDIVDMDDDKRRTTDSDDKEDGESTTPKAPKLVKIEALRPEGYTGTCLRPMGLCDLGACDGCMYNPELTQFKKE